MKRPFQFLLIVSLVLLTACSKDDDSSDDQSEVTMMKKYDVKSGIINFNVETNLGVTYSYKVYFDEYGAKEARYQYDDMNILTDITMQKADGWFYQISLEYGGGIKTISAIANGTEGKFIYEWTPEQMEDYDYALLSDTIVCGKTCKKYSFTSSASLSGINAGYKGITLYSKSIMAQPLYVVSVSSAISLEENAAIPESIWDLPENIVIEAYDK